MGRQTGKTEIIFPEKARENSSLGRGTKRETGRATRHVARVTKNPWPWNNPAKVRSDWKNFFGTLETETYRKSGDILRKLVEDRTSAGDDRGITQDQIIPLINATRSYAMIAAIGDFLETNGTSSGKRKWQELSDRAGGRMESILLGRDGDPLRKLKDACSGCEANGRISYGSRGVAEEKVEELWDEVTKGVKRYVDLGMSESTKKLERLGELLGNGRTQANFQPGALSRGGTGRSSSTISREHTHASR